MKTLLLPICVLFATVFLAGCFAMRPPEKTPDETFGHRVDGIDEDGSTTVVIRPPVDSLQYRTLPAVFQDVTIRPAPMTPDLEASGVEVEVLIKGAFPDSCSELHEIQQERTGNILRVDLTMRRPQGAICASVLRPYRFYFMLEGSYGPGPYSLMLNGESHPFEIRTATTR